MFACIRPLSWCPKLFTLNQDLLVERKKQETSSTCLRLATCALQRSHSNLRPKGQAEATQLTRRSTNDGTFGLALFTFSNTKPLSIPLPIALRLSSLHLPTSFNAQEPFETRLLLHMKIPDTGEGLVGRFFTADATDRKTTNPGPKIQRLGQPGK